jgi:hypothetical protein
MSALDPSAPASLSAASAHPPVDGASAGCPDTNGRPGEPAPAEKVATSNTEAGHELASTSAAGGETCAAPDRSQVDRADQMVERAAEKVVSLSIRCGRGILRLLSRVREEAEDMWAEAQSIRRGDQR